jgi:acyl-coenzyme A synthetase/AMP-(fatty) acid ligase
MGQGILGIRENDVVHSASKLFFAYGLGNAMTFPLSVGATAALWPERPSPEGVFEMMRKHRPTIFYGVPSLYAALLAHPEIGKGAGSDRLRICVSAGEALPAHIGERWREIVGVDVLDGLGSTELLNTFLSNRPADIRYGSTGKPVPKVTGTSAPRAGARFAANGRIPATNIAATPMAIITTAGAPTTCSRCPACGCRHSMSRRRSPRTRRCWRRP